MVAYAPLKHCLKMLPSWETTFGQHLVLGGIAGWPQQLACALGFQAALDYVSYRGYSPRALTTALLRYRCFAALPGTFIFYQYVLRGPIWRNHETCALLTKMAGWGPFTDFNFD